MILGAFLVDCDARLASLASFLVAITNVSTLTYWFYARLNVSKIRRATKISINDKQWHYFWLNKPARLFYCIFTVLFINSSTSFQIPKNSEFSRRFQIRVCAKSGAPPIIVWCLCFEYSGSSVRPRLWIFFLSFKGFGLLFLILVHRSRFPNKWILTTRCVRN